VTVVNGGMATDAAGAAKGPVYTTVRRRPAGPWGVPGTRCRGSPEAGAGAAPAFDMLPRVSADLALDLALIAAGVALLYTGGELLVGGATALARRFGVSPMVVGLTVVAFGTSSPELAATLVAAVRGVPEVAIGNVLGSNVANLGLILGASALLYSLTAELRFIFREIPFMVLAGALMYPLAWNGVYGRGDGVFLLALLVLYLAVLVVESRRDAGRRVEAEFAGEFGEKAPRPVWRSLLMVAAGIALLTGGAHVLVEGAVGMARLFGIPEKVVGVSLVALGTSLPELAACLVAAARKEADIVLGNLVGSNVFNVLGILGTTALVSPLPVALDAITVDFAVMMAFSLLLLPLLGLRKRIARTEGLLLVAGYVGYIVYLYL
jgi:cation:H+ antiporter